MSNHHTRPLVLRFSSELEKSDNRLWGCHFQIPPRKAVALIEGVNRRVVCSINGSREFQCAILHRGRDVYLITVNKKLRTELGLEFGDRIKVSLRRDRSAYGHPFPTELVAVFNQDQAGRALFDALTIGKQRTLLYMINSVRNQEKRIARAVAIVEHLKANRGTIDYRRLNEAMRDPRRRTQVD